MHKEMTPLSYTQGTSHSYCLQIHVLLEFQTLPPSHPPSNTGTILRPPSPSSTISGPNMNDCTSAITTLISSPPGERNSRDSQAEGHQAESQRTSLANFPSGRDPRLTLCALTHLSTTFHSSSKLA